MIKRMYDVVPTKWFDNVTGYRVVRLADGATMGSTFLCSEHVDARAAAGGLCASLQAQAEATDPNGLRIPTVREVRR